jgi:DNA polymerase V
MPVYALVDCNNFYCSCERVFQPHLDGKPVVVLSNNDGCAVSRSSEAKLLGVKMAQPIQHFMHLVEQHGIHVFSSNYTLYGDMSWRVTEVLRMFSPLVEVYSIDESFLLLDGFNDLIAYARKIRATVRQWTKIPTCVGIGPTKTLAKLANHIAKTHPGLGGVCSLLDPKERLARLADVAVGEVWGIGHASEEKLAAIGIRTVSQLLQADAKAVRGLLTVVGERIVRELHGQACIELDDLPAQRKGMASTRSFGRPVTEWREMSEALVSYASRVAEKLREHGLATDNLTAFLETNRFKPEEPQYNPSRMIKLSEATNDTRELVDAAVRAGKLMWKDGFKFKKSGVVLADLVQPSKSQRTLFGLSDEERARRGRLMAAMDRINLDHGRGALQLGGAGLKQGWQMRRERMSRHFTTRWDELLKVQT